MTREEQIIEAAEKATYQKPPQYSELVHKSRKVMSAYEVGFIDGCVWADQHPHWIPVEERLPEIPKNDWKSNNVLFVVNGEIFYGYHGKYTWHAPFVSFNNHEVTHWMEIVPPRKED